MSRPMLLFEALQRSSRTVDPEVCLPAFLWKALTWSNAKTPTGSASDSSLTAFKSTRRPCPPRLGVSDPQVLLQRCTCIRHFKWRRGATTGVFRSLPHLGGVHRGLHGRLDQQEYASQGNRGHYTNDSLPSRRQLLQVLGVSFCPSSLLVLHADLQLLLSREHQPATSHQQQTVTLMPF